MSYIRISLKKFQKEGDQIGLPRFDRDMIDTPEVPRSHVNSVASGVDKTGRITTPIAEIGRSCIAETKNGRPQPTLSQGAR